MKECAMARVMPTVRQAGEGERRWFYGGGVHEWKVTAAESDGAFLLFEDTMERGKVTPLHTHPASETMYVVAGEVLMHIDGIDHRIGEGAVAVAPRDVPHAFMVLSESATLLCLQTPGCCQAFYLGASEPLDEVTERVVDFDRVAGSARTNGGITILGPPPFAAADTAPAA
jgi:quercetin dioxygenase-like cupin family protein